MTEVNTELLKLRVRKSGFNYNELADNADVSRNTIRNVLNGKTTPSHFVTASLSRTLKLSGNDFITIFYPDIPVNEEFI